MIDLYNLTTQEMSKLLTLRYSTSFGLAIKWVDGTIRDDIFNIYGLVRLADEIVDTYKGPDSLKLLNNLEKETYDAIGGCYSANPVVHAFQITAREFGISKTLIQPFFASMRVDIDPPRHFSQKQYEEYIYGSAEVVGLMCLKVFVAGNKDTYNQLSTGAARLGAAFQKVNFLRDFAEDSQQLDRVYFPNITGKIINDLEKEVIIRDIQTDFAAAKNYISALPSNARVAVAISYGYYLRLLNKLDSTPASVICVKRIRVSNLKKFIIMVSTAFKYSFTPRKEV